MSISSPKIINAFDGREYHIEESFPVPGPGGIAHWKIIDIFSDRLTSVRILIEEPGRGRRPITLPVHLFHPSFMLQRVAIIPT